VIPGPGKWLVGDAARAAIRLDPGFAVGCKVHYEFRQFIWNGGEMQHATSTVTGHDGEQLTVGAANVSGYRSIQIKRVLAILVGP